jgi:predicted nuclease of predicted toxin-antitoxin system
LSSGAPPENGARDAGQASFTLFIDRDTWSHLLDAELRAAGIPFLAHRDLFEPATPDIEWIAEVGRRGLVVVTCDKNIRRRPNELRAVRAAGVHLFALTSGNLSAADTAKAVIHAWRAIRREVARTPPPALFSISRAGEVRLLKSCD